MEHLTLARCHTKSTTCIKSFNSLLSTAGFTIPVWGNLYIEFFLSADTGTWRQKEGSPVTVQNQGES